MDGSIGCGDVGFVAGPSAALRMTDLWRVKESGRALLDTPPFAKCAKGRAPRVGVDWAKNGRVQVPIRRSFAALRMTTFVFDDGRLVG